MAQRSVGLAVGCAALLWAVVAVCAQNAAPYVLDPNWPQWSTAPGGGANVSMITAVAVDSATGEVHRPLRHWQRRRQRKSRRLLLRRL